MSANMIPVKHPVTVQSRFTTSGDIIPEIIKWPDGRQFEIDKIVDVRNAPSEAGGVGRRYRVKIMSSPHRAVNYNAARTVFFLVYKPSTKSPRLMVVINGDVA